MGFFNQTATSIETLATKPVTWGEALVGTSSGPQVGGFVVDFDVGGRFEYEEEVGPSVGLFFVSFRNSGHMVPGYVPQRSLHVLHRLLLGGKVLSPPLLHELGY